VAQPPGFTSDTPLLTRARRAACSRCARPLPTCLCPLVPGVLLDNATPVLVLQHPREAREAKGSAALLALGLARCRVQVGDRFEPDALAAWLHPPGRQSVLLYPATGLEPHAPAPWPAGTGTGTGTCACAGVRLQLVVIDTTWRKSLRVLLEHPALQALPRLPLGDEAAPLSPSLYGALRATPRPGQLSTLEATVQALARLDGPSPGHQALRDAFAAFVQRELARGPRVARGGPGSPGRESDA